MSPNLKRTHNLNSDVDDDVYTPERTKRRARVSLTKQNKPEKHTPRLSQEITRRSPSSASSTLVADSPAGEDVEVAKTVNTEKALPLESVTVGDITLRPSVAFDTFWRVAAERQAIDVRRRAGLPAPWTDDRILRDYFFCNAYRVLDKGCQYLIREVIEKGLQDPEEVVFRVVLFNTFTKIETWELLDRSLGPLTWKTYDRDAYCDVLAAAEDALYTGAFIKPAPHFGLKQNYANHLCLLESLMENKLTSRLLNASYLADVYEYLISFPSMGPFSTYQLMLCLSYTDVLNFHENDFVVPGPGSISGLNKLFGKSMQLGRAKDPQFDIAVMRWMAETQDAHFARLGIAFSGLGPTRLPMNVADIEHTLCEVDKYCRAAHPALKGKRTNLHRRFTPVGKTAYPSTPAVPKAWAHPARSVPRIRPDTTLVVQKRYEVSHISDDRLLEDGQRQYFVYWVGYPPSDASWEFESSLAEDAPATIAEYLEKKDSQAL